MNNTASLPSIGWGNSTTSKCVQFKTKQIQHERKHIKTERKAFGNFKNTGNHLTSTVKPADKNFKPKPIFNKFNWSKNKLYVSALERVSVRGLIKLPKFEQKETAIIKPTPDPAEIYAIDIFNSLKMREKQFLIDDYMERQVNLSKNIRSILINWLIAIQEAFKLQQEILFLAVKIVDLFLCKVLIKKDQLQLLGFVAIFIACKYDSQDPPLIYFFLNLSDDLYRRKDLLAMERLVLRTINFDLGIPLSYCFLWQCARGVKILLPTIILASYILKISLMDYDIINLSDSRLACAALFIALRMHDEPLGWSTILEDYTGYKLNDFADIVTILNAIMHKKEENLTKEKHRFERFHDVVKVELMSTVDILQQPIINICLNEEFNTKNNLNIIVFIFLTIILLIFVILFKLLF